MLNRSTSSQEGIHPRGIQIATHDQPQPAEVLEELRDLLAEYAPNWYTQEYEERVQTALRSRNRY